MKVTKEHAIEAYKMFEFDFKCRGFQYEIGKEYFHNGRAEPCAAGFHACEQLKDCFRYYRCVQWNKIAKVLVWGDIEREGSKICASNIKIVEEIPFSKIGEIIKKQSYPDGLNRSKGVNLSSGVNGSHGVSFSDGVNGSHGVNRSAGLNRSKGVNLSSGLNRSKGVNLSSGVNGSHGVSFSAGLNRSHGVNRSAGLNRSKGVNLSSGLNRSKGVNLSSGVNGSEGVNGSHGVSSSKGVNGSYGILNCFGINNALFCSGLKPQPILFNKKITIKRFETVYDKLVKLLKGWRPTFNNLRSLYLKHGSEWKATPIPNAEEISKKEAWASMPKEAIDFLVSLKEFDPEIFFEITGIKINRGDEK